MYKHLLLPTDGSEPSRSAAVRGIELASSVGARVTGLYAMPEFHVLTYRTEMLEDTKEQYAADCRTHAEQYLAVIRAAAQQAGVACETVSVTSDHPFEAIIETAERMGCDLIVMAAHGRRGLRGLLLASETNKVLTHTKLPVLVYR